MVVFWGDDWLMKFQIGKFPNCWMFDSYHLGKKEYEYVGEGFSFNETDC